MGQPRMDNLEELTTFGYIRHRTKTNETKITTQIIIIKKTTNMNPPTKKWTKTSQHVTQNINN